MARHAQPSGPYVAPRARQIEIPSSAKPDIFGGGYVRRSGLYSGDLDDLAIYNRVLVAAEVAALYAHPVPDPP
jgi:hypothetical protein